VLQGPHVVLHLPHVAPALGLTEKWRLDLEGVQVNQRSPGALDSGGEDCFTPREGSGEQVGIRQGAPEPGQLAEGSVDIVLAHNNPDGSLDKSVSDGTMVTATGLTQEAAAVRVQPKMGR
jgi:hypothetical protein